MVIGLADNPRHVAGLCARLDLGAPRVGVEPVFGGFHHRMWRLDTHRGSYAVKQLSPDVDVSDSRVLEHYNQTEAAAEAFARCGVPAVVALRDGKYYLQLMDEAGYLVYPWTDARARDRNDIPAELAERVAGIMAKMHRARIQVGGLPTATWEANSEEKVAALVEWALQRNIRDASELESRLPSMLEVVRLQDSSIRTLRACLVLSHGDMDHKNVLWTDRGEPLLIDWESVRWLNPTHELILEALDWSGITGNFSTVAFADFLAAYRRAGGVIDASAVDASINCVFGDWLNWLMYNVGRAMDVNRSEEHQVGSEQVDLAFSTMLRMERQLPRLLAIVREQAGEVYSHV